MQTVTSKDGTKIAFDKKGRGPSLVIVGGALSRRTSSPLLIERLSADFTVYSYDRRGRGDSGDTMPYSVEREGEDLYAVLGEAGDAPFVLGRSAGAVLSLSVAERFPKTISKLALYEPPFIVDNTHATMENNFGDTLDHLVSAGRRGDAVAHFLRTALDVPDEVIAEMRTSPGWMTMEQDVHTLRYDGEIMNGLMSGRPLPANRWSGVVLPVLVMAGGASPSWLQSGTKALSKILENALYRILPGQTHNPTAPVLASALKDFFTA